MAQATLYGPQGVKIVLDTDEIIPDDPGAGTPAMVILGEYSATYWYAIATGEVYTNNFDKTLSPRVLQWLEGKEKAVDRFLYH